MSNRNSNLPSPQWMVHEHIHKLLHSVRQY